MSKLMNIGTISDLHVLMFIFLYVLLSSCHLCTNVSVHLYACVSLLPFIFVESDASSVILFCCTQCCAECVLCE